MNNQPGTANKDIEIFSFTPQEVSLVTRWAREACHILTDISAGFLFGSSSLMIERNMVRPVVLCVRQEV